METRKKDLGVRNPQKRTSQRLTETIIRTTLPSDKPLKLFDKAGYGLFLLITPSGSKLWRLKYRFSGKEKLLALGPYPLVSLREARQKCFEARKLLLNGTDPTKAKNAEKAQITSTENTFSSIGNEWLAKRSSTWSSGYTEMVRDRLEKQLYPWIGNRPIREITAPELLAVLRRIESRGALEVCHRSLQHASNIFRYTIACGLAEHDPASDLRGAITPIKVKNYSAIVKPEALGEFLRAIEAFSGTLVVGTALRLLPYLFCRHGELRRMEWSEINFNERLWRIPAEKMKMRTAHLVPLSTQALILLEGLRPLTGQGRYVFPSERTSDRPISESALNGAIRRLGYSKEEVTPHGFRSTASTLLNELGFKPDVIEKQLAHAERNPVRSAYLRAEFLDERRAMMQAWSDYLDTLKAGNTVSK
ncbi:MAG: tyrosine-type recombinase/integrase [Deltaproteobacteria bacterium]|nr:tyrosine-type recombinase/integrase [Deltaproteobacteria bacterium]